VTLTSGLLRVLATAASLAALVALWRYRPAWPDLPDSLSTPVTTTLLQELTVIAAWLLAALLVLVLLARNLARGRGRRILEARSGDVSAAARSHTRERRIRPVAPYPVGAEARLVILTPDEVARHSSDEDVAAGTPDHDVGPGERPLISLLGPLTIHGAKQSRRGLRARAFELIAFLALRQEGAQRDEILEALWPGEDPKRSRHRLYQAVRDARRLLGDAVASERDRYWLDRTYADVDVDELERLLATAKAAEPEHAQVLIDSALRLFRGDPLAGSDYAWSETEVPSLRATFVDLLEQVARQRLEVGEARAALDAALRGLDVDTLNESLWRLAMEAESALGLREAVFDRYERLRALLDERLGLEPEQETRRLHRRLLAQT
jgi:DNA-binding SARP family transcriptional activator